MITMKGAAVSAKLKEQVEKGLETLTWVPKLTIIRVGENPDDISYEKGATKKLTSFGLEVESKVFPGDISDEADCGDQCGCVGGRYFNAAPASKTDQRAGY